ncbi:hypothetical protein D3C73_1015810 [compost metagenome]
MDFIINHVCQLDHVHDTNGNFTFETFTCTSIIQHSFTITLHSGFFHRIKYVVFISTVKYWRCNMNTETKCSHTKVNFQYLTNVHP